MIERGELPGFQKPQSATKTKAVGMARISYVGADIAACSCGWGINHPREKVREDRIDTHIAKKHNGRGFRL